MRRPPEPRRTWARHTAAVLAVLALGVRSAIAEESWTLDRVLEQARSANATLPPARADVLIGAEAVREARAGYGPRVSVGGDLRYAPPRASYDPAVAPINEERLQLLGEQPVYDRKLGAKERSSEAELRSARARYRVAERDLELEVRTRYSELLRLQVEAEAHRRGLSRLRAYLDLVRERIAAGRGLEADRLKTQVRLAGEEAGAAESERGVDEAKLELNDLMGRDPSAPLELVPLPAPAPPASAGDEPWRRAPELEQAEAAHVAALAAVDEARAERSPQLSLSFDAGGFGPGFPLPGPSGTLERRLRDDVGVSVTLSLT